MNPFLKYCTCTIMDPFNGSLPHVWCDLHVHVYTGGHTNHKVLDAGTVEPL